MMPRRFDERVGFFSIRRWTSAPSSARRVAQYITQYRLECADAPDASGLCNPKKPIVYYVDPDTPDQWKPWIRKAITDWQPAFEAAGFKNAHRRHGCAGERSRLVARGHPPHRDPLAPSARRRTPSGPHVSDPRTGEILNGSVRMFQNVLNLQRDWYFTQAAQLDPRARTLPDARFADGPPARVRRRARDRPHASACSTTRSAAPRIRPTACAARAGCTGWATRPSIMDYSRFNYVAQPEDNIALEDIVPRVGPYDKYAIMWGYKPIPGASTPDAGACRRSTSWARMQDTIPWYRFSANNEFGGYGTLNEAVGDADPVKSTGAWLQEHRARDRLHPRRGHRVRVRTTTTSRRSTTARSASGRPKPTTSRR